MKEPNMVRAKGDGIEIQIADWEGAGLPVLAIHGLTANSRCWDVIASALAPKHRFLAMDLRGRGLSDRPETGYTIEHHCRDVSALLSDLHLDRVVLMGHSLGAFVSLACAAKESSRVAGLVLVDGGAPLSTERWGKIAHALRPSTERLGKEFPSFEAYISPMKALSYFQPWTRLMETYFRYDCHATGGMVRSRIRPEHIREESANLVVTDFTSFYGEVVCPVLALGASEGLLSHEDLVLPQEGMDDLALRLSHFKGLRLEGTNHYSILFQPNKTRDEAVLNFLAGL